MRALSVTLEPRFPAAFLGHRDVLGFAILYQHRDHVEAADGAGGMRKSYIIGGISFSIKKSKPDTIRIHRAIVIVSVTATKVASESIILKHQRGGRIFIVYKILRQGKDRPDKDAPLPREVEVFDHVARQALSAFEHRRDRIFARLRDLRFKVVQVITSRKTIGFLSTVVRVGAGHEQAQIGPAEVETVAHRLARFDHLFGSGGLTIASVPAERKDQRGSDNYV
jgi:hypothetical protein